jgi:hypothetical protein
MSVLSVQLNNLLRSPMYDANGVMTFAWAKFFQGLAGPTTQEATLAADGLLQVNDYGVITGLIAPSSVPSELNEVDNEWPSGVFNSINLIFTLAHTPSPSTSLKIYQNGLRLCPGVDFSVFGDQITMVVAPGPGTLLLADYRY